MEVIMAVTIRDVARHAGVSVATVSRYLNHSPLIASESVDKVRRSIEELHYEPNFLARNMLTKQSQSIAFIIDDTSPETFGNDHFLQIQYGAEKALAEHGYYLMIISLKPRSRFQNLKKAFGEKRADGVIIPAQLADGKLLQYLREQDIPYVIIGRSSASNWVDIDNVNGGKTAAEYLLQTGISDICFVGNGKDKVFVQERARGYADSMAAAGLPSHMHLDIPSSVENGKALAAEGNTIHQGYVVSDNVTAFGLLQALRDRNIRVPEKVQVISFDDGIVSQLCSPALTVVDIDVRQLGIQAANLLYLQLQSESPLNQQSLLPVKLIQRGSSR